MERISKQAVLDVIRYSKITKDWDAKTQLLDEINAIPSISDGWIRCDERLPERYARCNFVVVSSDDHYNGAIYGGGYTGDPNNKYSKHEFSCPGIAFHASHWQPLPPAPTK